jgi:hypothetical protein
METKKQSRTTTLKVAGPILHLKLDPLRKSSGYALVVVERSPAGQATCRLSCYASWAIALRASRELAACLGLELVERRVRP